MTTLVATCRCLTLSFIALFAMAVSADPSRASFPSGSPGEKVFSSAKNSVLQIQIRSIGSDSQISTGSGFHVSNDGLVVSNYHVIEKLITQPGQFHANFLAANGEQGELQLLAVDVIHDLALLLRNGSKLPFLAFETQPMARGDTAYSMGNPRSVGLTIVEGTFNGLKDKSLYELVHFSGAINAGMSGGPAISKAGRVFGVNVSILRGGQLIGFLVPAKYAQQLIELRPAAPPTTALLLEDVAKQARQHGARAIESFGGTAVEVISLGGYRIPYRFGRTGTCANAPPKEDDRRYSTDFHYCTSDTSISATSDLHLGGLTASYTLYDQGKLDAIQLAVLRRLIPAVPDKDGNGSFPYADLTRYACRTSFVEDDGPLLRVLICSRRYKRLQGLNDIVVWAATQTGQRRELNVDIKLTGVPFDQGMSFVRQFLGSIKWGG